MLRREHRLLPAGEKKRWGVCLLIKRPKEKRAVWRNGCNLSSVEESKEMEDAILMISSEVFEKDKFFSFEMSLDMKENLPKEFWES